MHLTGYQERIKIKIILALVLENYVEWSQLDIVHLEREDKSILNNQLIA
jgi:hypothetical protein